MLSKFSVKVLLICAFFSTTKAFSQSDSDSTAYVKYKDIKIQGHCGVVGGANWRDKNNFLATGGIGFYIHPNYPVSKRVSLGAKIEYMGIEKFYSDVDNSSVVPAGVNYEISASPITSISLTTDYTYPIKNSNNKVLIGIGLGSFQLGSGSIESKQGVVKFSIGRVLGAEGYAGFKINQLVILGSLNFLREANSTLQNRDYVSIKLGYEIGGKPKTGKK